MKRAALAAAALLTASPALAAHCPPGQLYRVHLRQCVGLHSRLALAYAAWQAPARPAPAFRPIPPVRPELPPAAAPAPPSAELAPFPLPPLERPTGEQIFPPLVWPDPD